MNAAETKIEIVTYNHEQLLARIKERTQLLDFKRSELEAIMIDAEAGAAENGKRDELREEITRLEQDLAQDVRFEPAFRKRLRELHVMAAHEDYAKLPRKLEKIADKHQNLWDTILELMKSDKPVAADHGVRTLLGKLAAAEHEFWTVEARYKAARERYERGGLFDEIEIEPLEQLVLDPNVIAAVRDGSLKGVKPLDRLGPFVVRKDEKGEKYLPTLGPPTFEPGVSRFLKAALVHFASRDGKATRLKVRVYSDKYPPAEPPARGLVATGCPRHGSREKLDWLTHESPLGKSGAFQTARQAGEVMSTTGRRYERVMHGAR